MHRDEEAHEARQAAAAADDVEPNEDPKDTAAADSDAPATDGGEVAEDAEDGAATAGETPPAEDAEDGASARDVASVLLTENRDDLRGPEGPAATLPPWLAPVAGVGAVLAVIALIVGGIAVNREVPTVDTAALAAQIQSQINIPTDVVTRADLDAAIAAIPATVPNTVLPSSVPTTPVATTIASGTYTQAELAAMAKYGFTPSN